MKLLELWRSFFPDRSDSRSIVKDRLRVILAQDRSSLSPEVLALIKTEIIEIVGRYFEIEAHNLEINLETDDRTTILIANLPIVKPKPFKPKGDRSESFVLDLN